MTPTTNWPNPERPGVPMFPERDGWHILCGAGSENPTLFWWHAKEQCYTYPQNIMRDGPFLYSVDVARAYIYHGAVLTPTQISEMMAGERERCVAAFSAHGERAELAYNGSTGDEEKQYWRGALNTFEECRDEIRHLGDPS
ncbi:hypothetical protein [Acetobacter malorum]|uniref:hypothetical protein n=1 Tax=Acetobacter malorum TaxID=178901 RepID=UPI0039ED7A07